MKIELRIQQYHRRTDTQSGFLSVLSELKIDKNLYKCMGHLPMSKSCISRNSEYPEKFGDIQI